MINRSKVITFAILCFALYLLLFFLSNSTSFFYSYKKFQGQYQRLPNIIEFNNFVNEIDMSKALIPRGNTQDKDAANLILSYEDLVAFRDYYSESLYLDGYLSDEKNDWRKAKIILPGIGKSKIKIKIHGTADTTVRQSIPYLDNIAMKIKIKFFEVLGLSYGNPYTNVLDILDRGYAFKIKLRDDIVYKGQERLSFLAPRDDWTISSNALNKYIASSGIITSSGKYMNLFVNGTDIGLYLAVENIDKSLLERDFQITNYAILKNYDDWTKAWKYHYSPTMHTSFDIEQKGEMPTQEIALFQIKRLFQAIENSDYDTIKTLVDIKYLAKVYAFVILTGNMHPLGGDNLRYIYDFSKGTFKTAYRLENRPHKMEYSNGALNNTRKNNLLLEKLATQKWFRDIAYSYLKRISNDEANILKILSDEYSLYQKVSAKSNYSTREYHHEYVGDIETIKANLNIIKKISKDNFQFNQYDEYNHSRKEVSSEYAKAFITIEKISHLNYLNILNDSKFTLELVSVTSCDGHRHEFIDKKYIPPSTYQESTGIIKNDRNIEYEIPFPCIEMAEIYKNNSHIQLAPKNVYINYSSPFNVIKSQGLEQFGSSLIQKSSKDRNSLEYILKAGDYNIRKTIIFPNNAAFVINPGAKIFLSEGVSIYVRGDFTANGTKNSPILVQNIENEPFGSFAIKGTTLNPAKVMINNFHLSGGSESVLDGAYFSSQLSIHIADVNITNSFFKNSFSDDGINIKHSVVEIKNNSFINNYADQVDLDYVHGLVTSNVFDFIGDSEGKLTDGLDISGSKLFISENIIQNMADKGVSVGEKSVAIVTNNIIQDNNIGIALKDGSRVCLNNNYINKNFDNVSIFIKKNMYQAPTLFIDNQLIESSNLTHQNCQIETFMTNE